MSSVSWGKNDVETYKIVKSFEGIELKYLSTFFRIALRFVLMYFRVFMTFTLPNKTTNYMIF